MMAMSKFGPQIEEIKKKYGDNKQELNRRTMEIYKQQGITPHTRLPAHDAPNAHLDRSLHRRQHGSRPSATKACSRLHGIGSPTYRRLTA